MSTNIYHILDDLVKMVVRAFYQDDHAVVIDGLLREKKRIKDEDLARKLRVNQKHVRKLLMELKGDSMVKSMDVKIEAKGPNERAQTVLLWYVDYKLVIDVVKYKFYMIRKKMEGIKLQKIDIPTYKCVQCGASFNALDLPKLMTDTGSMECDNCSGALEEDQNNESLTQTAKHQSDLFGQLKKIIDQLKKTEGVVIPLFARDLADTSADQGPSYTINTSSAGVGPKPSAFPVAQSSQMQTINPASENVNLEIDILDSDNIEINKTTIKVDSSKKTGLASLPPWLLPTVNQRKYSNVQQQSSASNQSTTEQPTAIKDPLKFDPEFYISYIKNHYKEWEGSTNNSDEKQPESPLSTSPNIINSNNNDEYGHIDKKMKLNNYNNNNYHNNYNINEDNILVKVGEQMKPITDVTEDDEELMSSQEYEDYSSALYSYASKSISMDNQSLIS